MIFRRYLRQFAVKLAVLLNSVQHEAARQTLPRFANDPTDIEIALPRTIINPDQIFLGEGVRLGPGSLLMAIKAYPSAWMRHPTGEQPTQQFESKIVIGDRVTATGGLQVAAHQEIIIEDDVLFATNINLTDGLHGYDHVQSPYKYQGISNIAPIVIKRGSWIGQNVLILPGVTIGELSIIGANSVVTESIPDHSIAVGAPARVIKHWSETQQGWEAVGHFKALS